MPSDVKRSQRAKQSTLRTSRSPQYRTGAPAAITRARYCGRLARTSSIEMLESGGCTSRELAPTFGPWGGLGGAAGGADGGGPAGGPVGGPVGGATGWPVAGGGHAPTGGWPAQ